jgi:hypothetical protein
VRERLAAAEEKGDKAKYDGNLRDRDAGLVLPRLPDP